MGDEKLLEERSLLRQFLSQYIVAKRRRRQLEHRHDQITEELKAPIKGSKYSSLPRGGGGNNEGAASILFMLDDIEQRIQDEVDYMRKVLMSVIEVIDFLQAAAPEHEVLELRYIDDLSWQEITDELCYSRSRAAALERDGIDKLLGFAKVQQILSEYSQRGEANEKIRPN